MPGNAEQFTHDDLRDHYRQFGFDLSGNPTPERIAQWQSEAERTCRGDQSCVNRKMRIHALSWSGCQSLQSFDPNQPCYITPFGQPQQQLVRLPSDYRTNPPGNVRQRVTGMSPPDLRSEATGGGKRVYITNFGGMYHRAGCQHLRRSAIVATEGQARRKGYSPCNVCNPDL